MTEPEERPAGGTPPPEGLPLLPVVRPSLADFDKWLQKRVALTMGVVIVVAFLAKAFVPSSYSFTMGLILGVVALVVVYLIDFNRWKGAQP